MELSISNCDNVNIHIHSPVDSLSVESDDESQEVWNYIFPARPDWNQERLIRRWKWQRECDPYHLDCDVLCGMSTYQRLTYFAKQNPGISLSPTELHNILGGCFHFDNFNKVLASHPLYTKTVTTVG